MWISPRLRGVGRSRKPGASPPIVDRSAEKNAILRLADEEAKQIEAARRKIVTREMSRLSEFATLDRQAFALFLDCLGSALAEKIRTDQPVETCSSDGSLRVRLVPIPGGSVARLVTQDGVLTGPDHWVLIEDAFAGRRS